MNGKKLKSWTEDQLQTLKSLYPDHTNAEIAVIVGRSESAVSARASILGLRKDRQWMIMKSSGTAFRKGHVPSNKGRKWDEYMSVEKQELARSTCFKKGQKAYNLKPVGYERKVKGGYWEVKVAQPDVFKAKHRILWEEHYGPVPEGKIIVFIDGNRDNITIENLRMETMKEKFDRCCSIHTTLPPDIRSMVLMKGHLKRQINKIEKKNGKERSDRKTEKHEEQALGLPEQGR